MDSRISLKLEFNEIKKRLAQKAQSESAKKLALSLEPQIKRRAVKHLIDETKEAESIYLSCESLPIMSFPDITPERGRMRSGAALSPSELLRIMRLLKAAKRAKNAIKRDDERNIVLLLHFYPGMAAASVGISAAVIGFATWYACRSSLAEKTDEFIAL